MMTRSRSKTFVSDISKKEFPISEQVYGISIRDSILRLIKNEHPTINEDSIISLSELSHYREKYINQYILNQKGDVSGLEQQVIKSLTDRSNLTQQVEQDEIEKELTFGERIADSVAKWGGSWNFIITFLSFMLIWISVNSTVINSDPYPFILLNLMLSCLAALQAPVIMMSQNRRETKDRERAKKNYMVNLKNEIDIRMIQEKLDHIILKYQPEMLEVQKIQIELLNDLINHHKENV